MDKKLTWREHIVKKRKQIDLMFKQLYWLLGRKSPLSLENKVLVYKAQVQTAILALRQKITIIPGKQSPSI
jgi:hypothetical protein